jgi:hypothetical protein
MTFREIACTKCCHLQHFAALRRPSATRNSISLLSVARNAVIGNAWPLCIAQTLRNMRRHAVQSNLSHARTFAQTHAPARAVYIYLLQGHDVQSRRGAFESNTFHEHVFM